MPSLGGEVRRQLRHLWLDLVAEHALLLGFSLCPLLGQLLPELILLLAQLLLVEFVVFVDFLRNHFESLLLLLLPPFFVLLDLPLLFQFKHCPDVGLVLGLLGAPHDLCEHLLSLSEPSVLWLQDRIEPRPRQTLRQLLLQALQVKWVNPLENA